jgi:hypothetical protein
MDSRRHRFSMSDPSEFALMDISIPAADAIRTWFGLGSRGLFIWQSQPEWWL